MKFWCRKTEIVFSCKTHFIYNFKTIYIYIICFAFSAYLLFFMIDILKNAFAKKKKRRQQKINTQIIRVIVSKYTEVFIRKYINTSRREKESSPFWVQYQTQDVVRTSRGGGGVWTWKGLSARWREYLTLWSKAHPWPTLSARSIQQNRPERCFMFILLCYYKTIDWSVHNKPLGISHHQIMLSNRGPQVRTKVTNGWSPLFSLCHAWMPV